MRRLKNADEAIFIGSANLFFTYIHIVYSVRVSFKIEAYLCTLYSIVLSLSVFLCPYFGIMCTYVTMANLEDAQARAEYGTQCVILSQKGAIIRGVYSLALF